MDTTARLRIQGTETTRIIAVDLRLTDEAKAMIFTVTSTGKIIYSNAQVALKLGYGDKDMRKVDVQDLMPLPYSLMHAHWLKGRQVSSTLATSCRQGRVLNLRHRNGKGVPVMLTVKDSEGEAQW